MGIITGIDDRVHVETSTTGTGTYTSDGPFGGKASLRDLDAIGAGVRTFYFCTDNVNWERGEGVVTIEGATKRITRAEITGSSNGGEAINWGAGTRELFVAIPGDMTVIRNRVNVFLANQRLDGNELLLSPDQATKLKGTNSDFSLAVGTTAGVTGDNTGKFRAFHSGSGADVGPLWQLDRNKSGNGAANDILGRISWLGKDGSGNSEEWARVTSSIVTATNGSEDGRYRVELKVGGAFVDVMNARQNIINLGTNFNFVGGGKTSAVDVDSVGWGLRADGRVEMRYNGSGSATLFVGRGDDGSLISLRVSGVQQGSITCAGTTVSYNAFHGSHWSWWAEMPEFEPPIGAVLVAVAADYRSPVAEHERLPLCRVSTKACDPMVYGLFGGYLVEDEVISEAALEAALADPRVAPQIVSSEPAINDSGVRLAGKVRVRFRRVIVGGLGTMPLGVPVVGHVAEGDLLVTSDVPGRAMAAPVETITTPSGATACLPLYRPGAVLGKALGDSEQIDGFGHGFVRGVIYAG